MSKALVIKGANFSTNAVAHITLSDPVPCTGITLNKATSSITSIGGTDTLLATVTPLDTTDQIVWTSSDTDVATVNNGVVTAVGLGSATITVTCGYQSATCAVSVTVTLNDIATAKLAGVNATGSPVSTGGNGLPDLSTTENRGTFLCAEGTKRCYRQIDGSYYYPVLIPNGAKRIRFTYDDISAVYPSGSVQWISQANGASGYPEVALLVGKTSDTDITPPSGANSITIDIPTFEGYTFDSIIVPFRTPINTTFVSSDFNKVTVEFLPAAN